SLPFSEWTQVIPNARLCKALIDRITDRAHIIETGAESYRFRRTLEKRKGRTAMANLTSAVAHAYESFRSLCAIASSQFLYRRSQARRAPRRYVRLFRASACATPKACGSTRPL